MNFKIRIILIMILLFNISFIYSANIKENVYLTIDSETGCSLLEKNADKKVYPASTTKILTCIIALENLNLNDSITVTKTMLDDLPKGSSTMKLKLNETLTVEELLYGLMLPSGNDAAIVIAHKIGNSIEGFSKIMNDKALSLGCTSTNFTCPHGFHDDNHYTTARDMAKIFRYAIKNETFLKIISTKNYTLKANDIVNYDRKYTSTNQLLGKSNYPIYGKTGYTEESGNVFASYSINEEHKLITILFEGDKSYYNTNYRFEDTLTINEYIKKNYTKKEILAKNILKFEIIDKNQNLQKIYSNDTSLVTLANDIRCNINYYDYMENQDGITTTLNVTGKNYLLNDYNLKLNCINSNNLKTSILESKTVKIVLFILIDVIAFILFFISIYMIIYLKNSTKRKKLKKKYY